VGCWVGEGVRRERVKRHLQELEHSMGVRSKGGLERSSNGEGVQYV